MSPRDALAAGVRDLRDVYRAHGFPEADIRDAMTSVIDANKQRFPGLFGK
jgi:hypothetical protein